MLALVPALALSACVSGIGDASDSESQDVSGTTYIELQDFSKVDQGAWYDATQNLNNQFLAACPGSYCTGEFANLTPLTFSCAVSSKEGIVHDCSWTFAASQVVVEPTTAVMQISTCRRSCARTSRAKTTAVKQLPILAATGSLDTPLPGEPSIDDQLAGCFDHPIGATPITEGALTPLTYVAASSYYTTAASKAKWAASQAALLLGFNNVCGDTF